MKLGTKAICINCAIVVGLLLELYWGRPPLAIGISALILLVVANAILLVVSRRARKA
jgi:hypothetical protein